MRPARSDAEFAEHRRELNRKLRAVYLAGAEEASRRTNGRGLAADEQARVMADYPGDLPTERSRPRDDPG